MTRAAVAAGVVVAAVAAAPRAGAAEAAPMGADAATRNVGHAVADARERDLDDDSVAQLRRPRPLWEAGVGLSVVDFPDYRGSARRSLFVFPIPYFVYRGPVLRIDRGGVKTELLDQGRLELNVSMNASVPVRSRSDSVRAGMPSLHSTIEVGPQLQGTFWQSRDGHHLLQFQLPLRWAAAVGPLDRIHAGFLFNPRLVFDTRGVFGLKGWNAALIAGPMFATARQHEYFYSVDPQFATASRPAYRAGGGYGGMQFTAGFGKRWRSWWLGGFARVDDLHGATFADSPLVQKKVTWASGIALMWIFGESRQFVVRKD